MPALHSYYEENGHLRVRRQLVKWFILCIIMVYYTRIMRRTGTCGYDGKEEGER